MSMTERVRKLRQQSLDAVESISSERAELVTEFYREMGAERLTGASIPMQRALLFSHLM